MEVYGLEADDRVTIDPGFHRDAERTEAPLVGVSAPRAHRQLSGVGHEIGIGLEETEYLRANPLFFWVLLAQPDVPEAGVGKAEKGFNPSPDVDQLPVVVVLVYRVQPEREGAGAPVQHGNGPKDRFLCEVGALLEEIGLAFEEKDGTREHDDEEHLSVEGVAVVVRGPQGDASS